MKKLESTRISLVTNKKDLKNQIAVFGSNIESIFHVDGDLSNEKSILRELWRNEVLKEGEIIISISGFEYQDMPHRISISSIPWDLYNESRILSYQIPHNINLEILSRVIYLALELARQGREGKPVGTIFVLGDYDKVKPYCKQLIINPFGGLDKQSRSILDPTLSETIKEYSKIDGAFIIGNDGLIHSAGTYLSISPNKVELASGLGARHAAAMGITLVAPVVSAVISESTGNIRVFWNGVEQDKYISSD
jgi:DNA integrity scanning protein DisA with diadenylate cyclase activity